MCVCVCVCVCVCGGGGGGPIKYQAKASPQFLKAICYIFFISDCPFVFEHDKDTFDTTLPEIDLMMSPVKIYKDPFRKGNHKIVLCQVLYPDGSPTRKYARMSHDI